MKIPLIIYLCLISSIAVNCEPTVVNWVEKALKEVKFLKSVAVWNNIGSKENSSIISDYENILKHLTERIPVIATNLLNPPSYMEKNKNSYFAYNHNISAQLHFIILVQDKKNNYFYILGRLLENIKESSYYLTTTKCFVAFYIFDNYRSPAEMILDLGIHFRFLDYTVLEIIKGKLYSSYNYDYSSPFIVHENTDLVFPRKLKEMNGYKFRVGVHKDSWPSEYKSITKYPPNLEPYFHMFKVYECFARVLNVTSIFVPMEYIKDTRLNQIRKHKLEVFLGTDYLAKLKTNNNYAYIIEINCLMAVVPMINNEKIQLSNDILYSVIALFCLLILTGFYIYYFNLDRNDWSALNIFNLMLSNGVSLRPENLKAKFLYIMFLFLSIFFTSDILTGLTQINFMTKRRLLAESIEDILHNLDSNITVCSAENRSVFLNSLSKATTNETKFLLDLAVKNVCPKKLLENNILINTEIRAGMVEFDSLMEESKIILKAVDVNLPIMLRSIFFQDNSQFRLKKLQMTK